MRQVPSLLYHGSKFEVLSRYRSCRRARASRSLEYHMIGQVILLVRGYRYDEFHDFVLTQAWCRLKQSQSTRNKTLVNKTSARDARWLSVWARLATPLFNAHARINLNTPGTDKLHKYIQYCCSATAEVEVICVKISYGYHSLIVPAITSSQLGCRSKTNTSKSIKFHGRKMERLMNVIMTVSLNNKVWVPK